MTFQNTNPWETGSPHGSAAHETVFFYGLLWPLPNISVPRYSTRQAGPSWRGRLLQAKLMLHLQDDNSSFPALFSCSPCFVLAILSCVQRSKGCSRPLGIRTLWPCLQNISFSISVYSPVCTDSRQSWGAGGCSLRNELCWEPDSKLSAATAQLPGPPCKRDVTSAPPCPPFSCAFPVVPMEFYGQRHLRIRDS